MLDASLPLTVKEWEEWGDPLHNGTMYGYMAAYSPVDNIAPQAYPHMLVTGGLNDRRVGFWDPAKVSAAALARVCVCVWGGGG